MNPIPKLIYKQQHFGSNGRKFTASRNAHYVKYIGEREHVFKSSHESNLVKYMGEREHAAKQSDNGLFGYINGSFSDNYSTPEMQNYVRKISTSHRNVFHSFFSFTPESAEEAGLRTLIDWEEWVKFHIGDISRNMKMKQENIEYLAAVHLKDDDEVEEGIAAAEYHTDTDVYTSFYAVNIGDTPFIGKSSFSIFDSSGDTPKMYEQLKEENKELIKVTGSQSGVSYTYAYTSDELETVHADEDDRIKIFVDNPANVTDEDGNMPYVSPYKLLGSYKHGDEINLGSSFKGTVAYKIKSTSGSTLKSGTVEITCPAGGEETMGWIKWHTPSREQSVVITLESKRDTLLLLDEDGKQCDKLTINADIAKVKESTPPDPLVSDTKPSWQKVYSQSSVQERISGYVSGDSVQELSWYTWSIGAGWSQDSDYDRRRVKIITGGMTDPSSQTPYWGAETENQDVTLYKWGVDNRYYPSETASKTIGSFYTGAVYISTSDIQLEKVTYSVSMSAEAAISPSDYCKTATYSESSGKYTMKSGYGIQISVDAHLSGDTQYCTGSQTANVLFPEFNYNRHSTTLYNRLLEKSGGSFVFKKNKYSTYNDRVHFTPIWFPDRKNYTVYVEVFDVWCPAGQLSVRLTDQIFLNGNVYDDWHIAPTKP